jgi:hypothetical protein
MKNRKQLPTKVDLREQYPPILNQEELASSSCCAGVAAKAMSHNKKIKYIYYKTTEIQK